MDNEKLLEKVIKDRLKTATNADVDEKVRSQAHKEAMEAIDRQIQMKKVESSERELEFKQNLEEQKLKQEQSDKKSNKIIKVVEIAAIPVGLFVADCLFKRYYMRQVCNFEKDYSFTTTPGKGISSLFRFKN